MQPWRIGYVAIALLNIFAVAAVEYTAVISLMEYGASQDVAATRTPNPSKSTSELSNPVDAVVYALPEMAGLGALWLALAMLIVVAFVVLLSTRWPSEPSRSALYFVVRASIVVGVLISLQFAIALWRYG